MAFQFAARNLIKWPVTIKTRDEDGNEVEQRFHLLIEPIPRSERKRMDREISKSVAHRLNGMFSDGQKRNQADIDAALDEIAKREDAQEQQLYKRVKGWEGVEDEHGEDVPFSQENLQALCEWEVAYNACWQAVKEASQGAVSKNS